MPTPTRTNRLSLEQGRALIESLKQSGLTAAAYARSINLDARRLSFWKRRLRENNQAGVVPPEPSAFIRIDSEGGTAAPIAQKKPPKPKYKALLQSVPTAMCFD